MGSVPHKNIKQFTETSPKVLRFSVIKEIALGFPNTKGLFQTCYINIGLMHDWASAHVNHIVGESDIIVMVSPFPLPSRSLDLDSLNKTTDLCSRHP